MYCNCSSHARLSVPQIYLDLADTDSMRPMSNRPTLLSVYLQPSTIPTGTEVDFNYHSSAHQCVPRPL